MFFQSSATIALAGLSSLALAVNNLNFVYSQSDFSTIAGPGGGGNEYGHQSGFTITDVDGNELYTTRYINDYTPCMNTGDGKEFGMTSTCWDGTWNFHCKSAFSGDPSDCYATDPDNIHWDGSADSDTNFIGIAISTDGWCGGGFYAGPGNCSPDDTYTIV